MSEKLAARLWPGENPLWKRIEAPAYRGPHSVPAEVIGVAGDVKYRSLLADPPALLYLPLPQNHQVFVSILVRAEGDASTLAPAIRQQRRNLYHVFRTFLWRRLIRDHVNFPRKLDYKCALYVYRKQRRGMRDCCWRGNRRGRRPIRHDMARGKHRRWHSIRFKAASVARRDVETGYSLQLPSHILHPYGDGLSPLAPLAIGAAGVLSGTTKLGGAGTSCPTGCGTVFSLNPPGSPGGAWTKTILHAFSGPDGSSPEAGLLLAPNGALYGTTAYGGNSPCPSGCGTISSLSNAPP